MISAFGHVPRRLGGEAHHQHGADREVRRDEDVGAGARAAQRRRGRSPVVPMTTCTPAATHASALLERRVGPREVDDDVGVAEDVGERRAERRVGAAGELHVVGAPRRAAQTVCAHPARRRRRRRRGSARSRRPRQRRRDRLAARRGRRPRRRRCPAALRRSGANSSRGQLVARRRASRRRCARSTSSTVSSGMSASTDEPSRFIRAVVDSSASTMRPLTFSLARCELLGGDAGRSRRRSSSSPTTCSAAPTLSGRVPR